ncbi:hypothetical protein CC85DRAFT_284152 [Cutaneotrichosporon oleaginosum]|uniref:Uncharacterized protein n=1 Tax=Cutaneotrichosporon oleaginosum TaxID=879819 RepID=A0A0J0XS05_9TREE|nr:uncharacterized protein CC85DRAFT_284152 [Cutaneotrichosporon oleaginosum]KLT43865.1 hypothetical protein CC85DRAFT_284152 [Cutaneotrichosporon oleaginosum]TXT06395.1 hypothetical protein COLE_05726 [Cutaneotrichosporon oleaginosum]
MTDLREPHFALTEANLAAHTGAPLPPRPWDPADAAVFQRVRQSINNVPIDGWYENVVYRRSSSEISLLDPEELYALEGIDNRALQNPVQPPSTHAGTPSHRSTPNGEAASPAGSAGIVISPVPSMDDLAAPPGYFAVPHAPTLAESAVLEQLVELRARAEMAEARARYFEIALTRVGLALEAERARVHEVRSTIAEAGDDAGGLGRLVRRRCSRVRSIIAEAGDDVGGINEPGWSTYSPRSTSSLNSAAAPARADVDGMVNHAPAADVVARAWNFLVLQPDSRPRSAEEAREGMARIRQLYAPTHSRPAKRPRGSN